MTKTNITFLTGTRADYGKIKSLLRILKNDEKYHVDVIVTGMHLLPSYGGTAAEVLTDDLGTIHLLPNQNSEQAMEISLARTIEIISHFLTKNPTQLLLVHGDRIEALAGAIVGALTNVPVGHIEGGEVSGTVDGLIRHSISKLAHIHFVSNESAQNRLLQLGESANSIFNIGSPDIDLMFSNELPTNTEVKKRYEIEFEKYAIVIFHPVTSEISTLREQAINICSALKKSGDNYIVIKPNNDLGSDIIQEVLNKELTSKNFKHLPSMRFEYFLTLMKNSDYMLGNSSAGVRETCYYGVPSINIGSRQHNRNNNTLILNVKPEESDITEAINSTKYTSRKPIFPFGEGDSDKQFKEILDNQIDWPITTSKVFVDLEYKK
jgi:UDP-N-acetylglucosamine 2-epimerase (hydrolysing)